jgi:hypothetical protein
VVPSGDEKKGRGLGGVAIQTNWAASWVLSESLVTHWNVGGTVVPSAKNELGQTARVDGYNLGASLVWLAWPRLNFLVETVYVSSETVKAPDRTSRDYAFFVNPGVRAGFDFAGGLQIVPGVSFPLGIGPSAAERMLFLYLSFEFPYRSIPAERSE